MSSSTQSKHRKWVYALAGVALAGAAIVVTFSVSADSPDDPKAAPTIRTAVVSGDEFVRTLRVTGITSAQRFQALTAPRLQGSRRGGFSGVQRSSISSPTSSSSGTTTSGTTGGAGGSSTSATPSGGSALTGAGGGAGGAAAGAAGAAGAAMGGGRGTMSAAMQSSTSRFSGGGASSSGRSTALSSSNVQRSQSQALGSSGLGSTSENLSGGSRGPGAIGSSSSGGGGRSRGGSSRFGLTLLELAEPGVRVKKGDLLAAFDPESMALQVDDYEALVRQSEERMRSLRADLEVNKKAHQQLIDIAKADLEKARLDYKTRPVRSAIDTELLKLAVEEAEAKYKQLLEEVKFVDASLQAQMREAEIGLLQIRNELERAKVNLERMEVRSPIDGIVSIYTTWRGGEYSAYKQGDMVGPGSAFIKVVDPSSMIVEAKVNQVDVELIRIGQRATVRVDGFSDIAMPARVVGVGAITEQGGMMASFVKQIPIKLKLDELDSRVVPDLSVSVDIELDRESDLPVVPRSAIFADAQGKGPFVWVREGSGWQARPVELGAKSFTHATIRSGLKKGDVVALERPPAAKSTKGS